MTSQPQHLDPAVRAGIITAAVLAAGPDRGDGSWPAAVAAKAADITLMLDPGSDVNRRIDALLASKRFVGTLVGHQLEPSSTRGVLLLHTGTELARDGVPPGHETVRTDRTDSPEGAGLYAAAQALMGHRVLVHVLVEEFNGGQGKVRVVKHVTDLGADRAAPAPMRAG